MFSKGLKILSVNGYDITKILDRSWFTNRNITLNGHLEFKKMRFNHQLSVKVSLTFLLRNMRTLHESLRNNVRTFFYNYTTTFFNIASKLYIRIKTLWNVANSTILHCSATFVQRSVISLSNLYYCIDLNVLGLR